MNDDASIRAQLRDYILSEFLPGESAANLRDGTPLRTSGVLDSMATLRLVNFVEKRFGIEIDAYEAGVENFENIEAIAALVRRKNTGVAQ